MAVAACWDSDKALSRSCLYLRIFTAVSLSTGCEMRIPYYNCANGERDFTSEESWTAEEMKDSDNNLSVLVHF